MLSPRMLKIAAATGIAASRLADASPAPDTVGPEAEEAKFIDEIIVTATRREAPLSSIPISVYVLDEQELRSLGALEFKDYARTVPGLYFNDGGFGGEAHTIRGVSTGIFPEVNPATSVYLDDIPITHAGGDGLPYSPDPMLVDIQRIEVLRGPQGTHFGSSSMGGALRIISHAPDFSGTAGFIEADAASYTDGGTFLGLNGMFNASTAGGRAAVRGVGFHRDADGYIDNLTLGEKDVNSDRVSGGRLAVSLKALERVEITARMVQQNRKSDGTDIDERDDPDRTQSRAVREPNEDDWSLFNLVISADVGWGDLVSSTAYLDRTIDTRVDATDFLQAIIPSGTTLTAVNEDAVTEFTQEIRISNDADARLAWLAGFFYQNQSLDFRQDFPSPGFDAATDGLASAFGPSDNLYSALTNSELEQLAVFGDLTYRPGDNIELLVGMRWFEIERTFQIDATGLFNGGPGNEAGTADEDGLSPRLGVTYALGEDSVVFASLARGFRPGGVNSPAASDTPECVAELTGLGYTQFPVQYESDELWSYEVGLRSTLAGGNMHLSAAAFHLDWSDMQTGKTLDCGIFFIENAGKAVNDGIELAADGRLGERANIVLSASFLRAELDENVPNLGAEKGDRIPGIPEFTAALGLSYAPPEFFQLDNRIRLDYQYVGHSYGTFDASDQLRMPAYEVVNLGYTLQADRWSAKLYVNNLFDEKGVVAITNDILGFWATRIPPRRAGLALRWRF